MYWFQVLCRATGVTYAVPGGVSPRRLLSPDCCGSLCHSRLNLHQRIHSHHRTNRRRGHRTSASFQMSRRLIIYQVMAVTWWYFHRERFLKKKVVLGSVWRLLLVKIICHFLQACFRALSVGCDHLGNPESFGHVPPDTRLPSCYHELIYNDPCQAVHPTHGRR